jgi:molecular chaperone GrpE (heat shock protein)
LFGWVSSEQKKEDQLEQERSETLKASLSKIDEAVGGEIDTSNLERLALADRPRETSDANTAKEEKKEMAITLSGIFGLTGGAILGCSMLVGTAGLIKRKLFRSGKSANTGQPNGDIRQAVESPEGPPAEQRDVESRKKGTGDLARSKAAQEKMRSKSESRVKEIAAGEGDAKKNEGATEGSPKQSASMNLAKWKQDASSQQPAAHNKEQAGKSGGSTIEKDSSLGGAGKDMAQDGKGGKSVSQGQNGAVQVSDKQLTAPEEPANGKAKAPNSKARLTGLESNVIKLEDSVKAQTDDFEKRMAEFTRMAKDVQQDVLTDSKPVERSLHELTEQVSAIREYAAHQQERVKKLQDGYDWNIIKNFCLRIIRCIDNLENRIQDLAKQKANTTALEEVRDELVFALESTGVEQFRPETNSDYRGQEKNTEAVKEKEPCKSAKMKGKIAAVLRPGYHYFIDEDNVKLVRTAQVKLYG